MFNQLFYFQTIRKYVTLFGTLFNEISITKENPTTGRLEALIKVPITYAPKDKMLARLEMDPGIDRQSATITLPFMSFEMTSVDYDSSRKLRTAGRVSVKDADDANKFKYQYNPVPYNFGFRLYIYAKNAEDGTKIVEQILPYFTPEFTVSVNLIPEMNINMEIPTVLNNVGQEDTYEGNFIQRRAIIWTLDFLVKGYIYGPVKKSAVIKYANTVFYVPSNFTNIDDAPNETPFSSYTLITPGLTANGEPTTYSANQVVTAQAVGVLTGDELTDITVTNSGVGYIGVPTVTIDAPTFGTRATGTAVLNNGKVQSITITEPGDGYTSVPNITISDPDGGSISPDYIEVTDDFGYVVETFEGL